MRADNGRGRGREAAAIAREEKEKHSQWSDEGTQNHNRTEQLTEPVGR